MGKARTIIIGLDGATWHLLDLFMREGVMPTLKELAENGVKGDLMSTIPPVTPPSWTSAFTGTNPGKHNIYDFFFFKRYKKQLVQSTFRRAPTLWQILSRIGLRIGVINVPMTFPPERSINGFMISGMDTPSLANEFTNPPELKQRLVDMGYQIDNANRFEYGPDTEAYLSFVRTTIQTRTVAVIQLCLEFDCEVIIVVYMAPDRVQHYFWKDIDPQSPKKDQNGEIRSALISVYAELDHSIAKILKAFGEQSNTFIISDHGFGPRFKDIYINNYLVSQGLAKLKRFRRKALERRLILTSVALAQKIKVDGILSKLVPTRAIDSFITDSVASDIDWARTKVWFPSCTGHGFKFNLIGIDPQGSIRSGSEYEQLRGNIISGLMDLRDPTTGDAVVQRVYKKEDVYWGDFLENAPDLIIQMKPGYYAHDELTFGPIFQSPKSYASEISGDHRPEGIFLAHGSDIKKKEMLQGARVMDIAPTILHLLGQPIPRIMDGRVLKEVFLNESVPGRANIRFVDFAISEKENLARKISTLKRLGKL